MSIIDYLEAASARQVWLVVENLALLAAFVFAALRITMLLPVRVATRAAAVVFLLTCAMSHLDQVITTVFARHWTWGTVSDGLHLQFINIPEAIAAWVFFILLYIDLCRLRFARGVTAPAPKEPPL